MIEEHKHIWAAAGCYCGAQRCEFKILRETKEPDGAYYFNGKRITRKGKKVVPLDDPCKEAALAGEIYCDEHVKLKPASPLGGAA